jgi:hypothetical protein
MVRRLDKSPQRRGLEAASATISRTGASVSDYQFVILLVGVGLVIVVIIKAARSLRFDLETWLDKRERPKKTK